MSLSNRDISVRLNPAIAAAQIANEITPVALQASSDAAAPSTVFVELGQAAEQAAISRNGVQVPIVRLDPAALGAALSRTTPMVARVVSQSIPAGAGVPKGTSVDITLIDPTIVSVGVLQNAYTPLASQTLGAVYKNIVRDDPVIQSVLARNTSAATLSEQDQATLTQALSNAGAPVSVDAGHGIDAAFGTLQAALTFGA